EERVMARRLADLVEVVVLAAGAHALLRGRRTLVAAGLRAGEHVLELVHAGVREEQRRVVLRNERARRDDLVVVLLEKLQERTANVGCLHDRRFVPCSNVPRMRLVPLIAAIAGCSAPAAQKPLAERA